MRVCWIIFLFCFSFQHFPDISSSSLDDAQSSDNSIMHCCGWKVQTFVCTHVKSTKDMKLPKNNKENRNEKHKHTPFNWDCAKYFKFRVLIQIEKYQPQMVKCRAQIWNEAIDKWGERARELNCNSNKIKSKSNKTKMPARIWFVAVLLFLPPLLSFYLINKSSSSSI